MSKMLKVAEVLNVELGESFVIPELKKTVKIVNNGLVESDTMKEVNGILIKLLTEDYSVKRLPWKPKNGQDYFYIDSYVNDSNTFSYVEEQATWEDSLDDFMRFRVGNVFKTQELAKEGKNEIIHSLKRFYDTGFVI